MRGATAGLPRDAYEARLSGNRSHANGKTGVTEWFGGADWITIVGVVLESHVENGLRNVRVAIVGAGFGGIGAAIRLRDAGYEDVVILERDDGLGGTWWANTYPGCACDVAAHLYSFSFALNPNWSRLFAPQAEILEYLRELARDRGIEPLIRFATEVTGARWDEGASRWRVDTDRGAFSAQVLVSAAGGLTEPKLPAVPGLESFAGTMFHSARWDHGHDLSGERVGVIGTGSTASQIVPEVQPRAARLTVFQRSPGWVLPRVDHPHSDSQKRLLRRFPVLQRAIRSAIYYNNELLILGLVRRPRLLAGFERLALGYLKRQVPDPEIRAKLTPDYRIGCKRIIISSDFLGTFMKPNVELVTDGIRELVPDGIVTRDGRKIELDTIIFATGFDVMNPPHFRHVVGREGRSIREVWDENGVRAYLGTVIPGFPNHFALLGPNTASGNNSALQPIEAQIGFAIDALRTMDARGATAVDVRRDVMDRFDEEIQRRLAPTVWNSGGCHSWYVGADGRNFTTWPGFANEYKRRLARFDPAEFELTSTPAAAATA